MAGRGRSFALICLAVILLGRIAAAEPPRIWRASHVLKTDNRVVIDRLHARNNRNHEDYSFLNAVGAVWPADIDIRPPEVVDGHR